LDKKRGGNIDDKGYGSLGRSEMPKSGINAEGCIAQTEPKQANTLNGKYTYYTFTMTAENMNKNGGDGALYTKLFHSLGNVWLASHCVSINNSYATFCIFRIGQTSIYPYDLYRSDDHAVCRGYQLYPVVTIDLRTVKIEGEGTKSSSYTITKR